MNRSVLLPLLPRAPATPTVTCVSFVGAIGAPGIGGPYQYHHRPVTWIRIILDIVEQASPRQAKQSFQALPEDTQRIVDQ